MTWGVDGSIALIEMAKRTDDIQSCELMPFIKQYYKGKTSNRSKQANVLRIALRILGYKGNFVGRIHKNQTDYVSIRKAIYTAGRAWRLRKDACDMCGANEELRLHHIVPVSWGGDSSKENCITLCENCHRIVHRKLALLLNRSLLLKYLEPHKEEIYTLSQDSVKDIISE
jgi:hypothetical protein